MCVSLCLQVKMTEPLDADTVSFLITFDTCSAVYQQQRFWWTDKQNSKAIEQFCSGGSCWVREKKCAGISRYVTENRLLVVLIYQHLPNSLAHATVSPLSKIFSTIFVSSTASWFFYTTSKKIERSSNYRDKFSQLVFDKYAMPMKLNDVAKFESQNKISVRFFSFDGNRSLIYCHKRKVKQRKRTVFLSLLTVGLNSYFCLMITLQDFMLTLCRYPRKTIKGARTNYLVKCMQSIGKRKNADHVRPCKDKPPLRIVMPNEDFKLNFTNWEKTQKCPFVDYADLEALNVSANIKNRNKTVVIE